MSEVVVVGGGLAGIAAALELADGGAQVTLLERRSRLGGATFSVERDGLWIDNGQHVFLRCCRAYRRLLERLGTAGDASLQQRLAIPVLAPGEPPARLVRHPLPAPLQIAPSILRYHLLSPRERLAVGRAALALARVDAADPRTDEQTFGEWLGAHGQSPRALEALWDLIALPTLNLHAADASLALAATVFQVGLLHRASAGDVGHATVPLQRLHGDAAARALAAAGVELRLRARVHGLEPRSAGIAVRVDEEDLRGDAVVLAVPHEDARALLPREALPAGVELARLGAMPIVNLHVVYDRPVTRHPFAAAVRSPVQWIFDRTASAGLAGGQYLAVSLSGAVAEIQAPVEELRARYLPELARVLPEARRASVERFFVTREPRATFRQAPGTARHRPSTRTRVPGLYLAGAYTDTGWPATMEGAVRSGLAAARAALGGARRPLPEAAAA